MTLDIPSGVGDVSDNDWFFNDAELEAHIPVTAVSTATSISKPSLTVRDRIIYGLQHSFASDFEKVAIITPGNAASHQQVCDSNGRHSILSAPMQLAVAAVFGLGKSVNGQPGHDLGTSARAVK